MVDPRQGDVRRQRADRRRYRRPGAGRRGRTGQAGRVGIERDSGCGRRITRSVSESATRQAPMFSSWLRMMICPVCPRGPGVRSTASRSPPPLSPKTIQPGEPTSPCTAASGGVTTASIAANFQRQWRDEASAMYRSRTAPRPRRPVLAREPGVRGRTARAVPRTAGAPPARRVPCDRAVLGPLRIFERHVRASGTGSKSFPPGSSRRRALARAVHRCRGEDRGGAHDGARRAGVPCFGEDRAFTEECVRGPVEDPLRLLPV
ncbi:hypothetical protein ACVWZD_005241 [Streptomyces sp. TE3672]